MNVKYFTCFKTFTILLFFLSLNKIDAKYIIDLPTKPLCTRTGILPILQKSTFSLDEIRGSIGELRIDNTSITQSGLYVLGQDIECPLEISSDNVVLDLNEYAITDNTGTCTAIIIEEDTKNITIKNGSLVGSGAETSSSSGIWINRDCQAITVEKIIIKDFEHGIYFDGEDETATETIIACTIKDCRLESNNKGAFLNYTKKCIFEKTETYNCKEAGFDQFNSKFNLFNKCKALKTENSNEGKNAVGFSSTCGCGNIFNECVAKGTRKTGEGSGNYAAGFTLRCTETGSEIFNSIADTASTTDYSRAFGIYLEPTLLAECSTDYISADHGDDLHAVAWSPKLRFIAVGGKDGTDNALVRVFEFAPPNLTSFAHNFDPPYADVLDLEWSSDGKFLAVATNKAGADAELIVFEFDPNAASPSGRLTEIDSYNTGGGTNDELPTVAWSKGKYLDQYIAAGFATGSEEIVILGFDGASLTGPIATDAIGANVSDLEFSDDGEFLFTIFQSLEITVHKFDPTKPMTDRLDKYVEDKSYNYNGMTSIDLSPSFCLGKYIFAIGADQNNDSDIFVFSFNGKKDLNDPSSSLEELAEQEHGNGVEAVKWSEDGNYLLIGGEEDDEDYDIKLFKFDPSQPTKLERLILECRYKHPGTIPNTQSFGVDFSPNQQYIVAVGDSNGADDTVIFEAFNVPKNNIVKSNEATNNIGENCGVGIYGSSSENLIIRNIAYENNRNYSSGVFNIFEGGLLGNPSNIINISVPPYED